MEEAIRCESARNFDPTARLRPRTLYYAALVIDPELGDLVMGDMLIRHIFKAGLSKVGGASEKGRGNCGATTGNSEGFRPLCRSLGI
jgi:hypothetical protein